MVWGLGFRVQGSGFRLGVDFGGVLRVRIIVHWGLFGGPFCLFRRLQFTLSLVRVVG